jgi:prepilin-type N-terminal cleavage/methylation domain-containing protein
MTTRRRGFTLIEMAIVLAVMAVASLLVAPALARFGTEQPPRSEDRLLTLLADARKAAITHGAVVTVRLDPSSGAFRADSTTSLGTGILGEGTLDLAMEERLVTPLPRLTYIFKPTGAAFADTVIVRGTTSSVLVGVDAWSGVAYAVAR